MPKALLILGAGLLLVGCETETRVVRDNTVTSQFMRLDGKGGAHVTLGDGSSQRRTPSPVAANQPAGPVANPFANAVWTTNFKLTDQPQQPAAAPQPTPVSPLNPGAAIIPTAPVPEQ